MKYTTYLSLRKPDTTDNYSINDHNYNSDLIDTKVSNIDSSITTLNSSVSTLQGEVTSLDSRLDTAESNISTLQSDLSTLNSVAVKHTLATAANDFLVASGANTFVKKTLSETRQILGMHNGWLDAPSLSYYSADAPIYVVRCSGDYTEQINAGARIKLTHSSAVKYFIVVKSEYSGGYTYLYLYGGTDYTLSSGTISSPYYSLDRYPVGFPALPNKWYTYVVDDSTDHTISSPSSGTWYNPGSISISIPMGVWYVQFMVYVYGGRSSAELTGYEVALSSSTTSISHHALHSIHYTDSVVGVYNTVSLNDIVELSSKTTFYAITRTYASLSSITFYNSAKMLLILARCAFL